MSMHQRNAYGATVPPLRQSASGTKRTVMNANTSSVRRESTLTSTATTANDGGCTINCATLMLIRDYYTVDSNGGWTRKNTDYTCDVTERTSFGQKITEYTRLSYTERLVTMSPLFRVQLVSANHEDSHNYFTEHKTVLINNNGLELTKLIYIQTYTW